MFKNKLLDVYIYSNHFKFLLFFISILGLTYLAFYFKFFSLEHSAIVCPKPPQNLHSIPSML